MKKIMIHEWVKNGNLDTWMTSCNPLRSQALPFVYLGTVKLRHGCRVSETADLMLVSV